MTYHHALAHWQNTLREVLSDYVNGNFLRVRAKWAFPLVWGISDYAVEHAHRKLVYAAYPLTSYVKTPGLTAYLDQVNSRPPADGGPEMSLLTALTNGYLLLSQLVSQEQEAHTTTIHIEREFDVTEYERMDRFYFSPVVHLVRLIRQQMAAHLSLAVIHGSIGDLQYAKGYSDLDTWLILAESTVTDITRLRQFAQACYRSLADIYRFDPLQHHGHMVATAIDLRWYSESWLPADTFRHACRIVSGEDSLRLRVRDSSFDARDNLEELHEFMQLKRARQWSPGDASALKDYLSILMLAPALYLQAKGIYLAKQDSFQLAYEHLPNANWDAMRYATRTRESWPYYRNHLLETVRPPNACWVNAIQRRHVHNAYQSVLDSFPASCLTDAADLTQQMVDDVDRSAARSHALKQGHTEELSVIVTNRPLAHELRDYAETRAHYLAHTQQEPAVLAVYQYGNISFPGLSDLDLVIVMSETVESINSARLAVEALSSLDQSIMLHSPTVVPVSQVHSLQEFLTDAALQKIWAPHDLCAGLPALGAPHETYSRLAKLFETLSSYRIWISEVLIRESLNARWAIPTLKSIVYSCNIMESISGDALPWAADYRTAIQELRANWFLEESPSRQNTALRAVFRHGLQVVVGLMSEFDGFVRQSGWLTDLSPRQSAPAVLSWLNATVVLEEQHVKDVSRIITHPRQINLSSTFWKLLNFYAEAVDSSDRRGWTPPARTDFEAYLQERVKKINQQKCFLKRHHMNFGGYLPGQFEQFLGDMPYHRAERFEQFPGDTRHHRIERSCFGDS